MKLASFENVKVWMNQSFMCYKDVNFFLWKESYFLGASYPAILHRGPSVIYKPWLLKVWIFWVPQTEYFPLCFSLMKHLKYCFINCKSSQKSHDYMVDCLSHKFGINYLTHKCFVLVIKYTENLTICHGFLILWRYKLCAKIFMTASCMPLLLWKSRFTGSINRPHTMWFNNIHAVIYMLHI